MWLISSLDDQTKLSSGHFGRSDGRQLFGEPGRDLTHVIIMNMDEIYSENIKKLWESLPGATPCGVDTEHVRTQFCWLTRSFLSRILWPVVEFYVTHGSDGYCLIRVFYCPLYLFYLRILSVFQEGLAKRLLTFTIFLFTFRFSCRFLSFI